MTEPRGFLIHWSGVRIPSGAPRLGIFLAESGYYGCSIRPPGERVSLRAGTPVAQCGTRENLGAEAKARTAGSAVSTPLPEVAGANPVRPTEQDHLGETLDGRNRPGACNSKGLRPPAGANSVAAWSLALAAESLGVVAR